jgi:hypothetical protein
LYRIFIVIMAVEMMLPYRHDHSAWNVSKALFHTNCDLTNKSTSVAFTSTRLNRRARSLRRNMHVSTLLVACFTATRLDTLLSSSTSNTTRLLPSFRVRAGLRSFAVSIPRPSIIIHRPAWIIPQEKEEVTPGITQQQQLVVVHRRWSNPG